jgi:hypothetical protein
MTWVKLNVDKLFNGLQKISQIPIAQVQKVECLLSAGEAF